MFNHLLMFTHGDTLHNLWGIAIYISKNYISKNSGFSVFMIITSTLITNNQTSLTVDFAICYPRYLQKYNVTSFRIGYFECQNRYNHQEPKQELITAAN